MKKNHQKGFIQIPILIAIIAGILVLGGGGYFGVKQYHKYQTEKIKKERIAQEKEQQAQVLAETQQQNQAEKEKQTQELLKGQQQIIEETKKEMESLKKQVEKETVVSQKRESESGKQGLSNIQIINKVKPAVVYITTGSEAGSGMIIDSTGLVLTNAHVVNGASRATVKLADGRQFSSNVLGFDEFKDLALLKINANNLPVIELGDSSENSLHQGDLVFTLGYPFGLEGDVSFKDGTLSRRSVFNGITYLETSAEIHPGNSGGPLVNKFGQVVGINSLTVGQGVGGVLYGETIKFAIPISDVISTIVALKSGQYLVNVNPPPVLSSGFEKNAGSIAGFLVLKSSDNTPASEKGKTVVDPDTVSGWGGPTCYNSKTEFDGYIMLRGFSITLSNGSISRSSPLVNCNDSGASYYIENIPVGVYNITVNLPAGYRLPRNYQLPKTVYIRPHYTTYQEFLDHPDWGETSLWIWIVPDK